jgi:hypothetical protein
MSKKTARHSNRRKATSPRKAWLSKETAAGFISCQTSSLDRKFRASCGASCVKDGGYGAAADGVVAVKPALVGSENEASEKAACVSASESDGGDDGEKYAANHDGVVAVTPALVGINPSDHFLFTAYKNSSEDSESVSQEAQLAAAIDSTLCCGDGNTDVAATVSNLSSSLTSTEKCSTAGLNHSIASESCRISLTEKAAKVEKNELCQMFAQGSCKKGDDCRNFHGEEELTIALQHCAVSAHVETPKTSSLRATASVFTPRTTASVVNPTAAVKSGEHFKVLASSRSMKPKDAVESKPVLSTVLPTHHSPVRSPQLAEVTPAPGPAALSSDELTRLGGLSDHYAILGIKDQATEAEIKKSYRGLALKYHPDKTGGRPDATAVYSKIAGAYEILSDPEKRAAYDDEKAQPRGFGNLFNRDFFGDSDFFDRMSSGKFGKTASQTTTSFTRNGSSTKTTTTTYSYRYS